MQFIAAATAAFVVACLSASSLAAPTDGVFTLSEKDLFARNDTHNWMELDRRNLSLDQQIALEKVERHQESILAKRGPNAPPCPPSSNQIYSRSVLVGNGNPHQNYYYQQATGDLNCAGASGSVSYSTSTSWSWTADAGGGFPWITGGFSVSKSYSHTETRAVNCLNTDNQICIWSKIAHTAYTVQPQVCSNNGCAGTTCSNSGGHRVIFSPNSNQWGGCYYKGTDNRVGCANEIGECPGLHKGFWHKCGAAGGPPGHIVCNKFEVQKCDQVCKG